MIDPTPGPDTPRDASEAPSEQPSSGFMAMIPRIPGYQLAGKLGEGGMGKVYRAIQLSLSRPVAIKFLTASANGHAPAITFQRESRVMASLSHPNVVAIYDCGQIDGQYYLVMEHVTGSTLRELIQPGNPWSVDRALSFLEAIAQALTYIHGQGILHLDLKPENVLCGKHGEIKMTDFGLASPHVDARTLSELGLSQGTVDYCAPEQRYGLPTDQRSDLFSLAILAYELLTGRLPGRVYVPASQRNPRLPPGVDAVLERGLARDPDQRYASVEEFRQALADALRRPRPLLLVGGLLLVAALVGLLAWLRAGPGDNTATAQTRAWILYEHPETLAWLAGAEADPPLPKHAGLAVKRLRLSEQPPGHSLDPQLPLWPSPRPVLVLSSPKTWGFFHPLMDSSLADRIVAQWSKLAELPPVPAGTNLLEAGSFDGDGFSKAAENAPWRARTLAAWVKGDQIDIGFPPDRPGNPALFLVKRDARDASHRLGVFQKLSSKPGTIMLLRYRARAEDGEGRLAIGPRYPILIPKQDQSLPASRLRALCLPHRYLQDIPDSDSLEYWLLDWVTPTAEWQTYYVIWESPPYSSETRSRNLEIAFAGLGKVWIDDVELFTWEDGIAP